MNAHYRIFPLIQGSLEIPVEVTIEMDITEKNVLAVKYKALTADYYQQPMDQRFPISTESINF